jgi:hypothetical protein
VGPVRHVVIFNVFFSSLSLRTHRFGLCHADGVVASDASVKPKPSGVEFNETL